MLFSKLNQQNVKVNFISTESPRVPRAVITIITKAPDEG